jgi:hypothetical protein
MRDMVVTLEVFQLSGWLNADASCRVKHGSIRRGATCLAGGRGEAVAACRDPTVEAAGRARRSAHLKYALHGCDAGRVEGQGLVERRRALPCQKGSIGSGSGGGASSVQGDPTVEADGRAGAERKRKTCSPWM